MLLHMHPYLAQPYPNTVLPLHVDALTGAVSACLSASPMTSGLHRSLKLSCWLYDSRER